MLPERLRHLLLGAGLDHAVVHPDPRQGPPPPRLGLGDLVLVVGEDEVGAAAVDRELEAEQLLGHRRALDVPARPAVAPGARPERVLALLARLPEREVERRLLELGGARPPRPGPSRRGRGWRAGRRRRSCGPGSRRRRRTRRRGRARSAPRSGRRSGRSSRSPAARGRGGRSRARRCRRRRRRASPRRAGPRGRRAPRRPCRSCR